MSRWLLLVCVLGCTRENGLASCVVGEQRTCPCLGGESGVQQCLADRTFGSCTCASGDGGGNLDASFAADGSFIDAGDAGDDAGEDLSVGDLASGDLAAGDLRMPDLGFADLRGGDLQPADLVTSSGVVCVSDVCTGGQVCCLSGSAANGSCTSTCTNSSFSCDGPEDCPPGDSCCVDVQTSGSSLSGSASCAASCTGGYATTAGGAHEQSQLCHSDSDCTNISGPVIGLGPFAFSSCCHSATSSPYHVCIPGAFAATEGYTCP